MRGVSDGPGGVDAKPPAVPHCRRQIPNEEAAMDAQRPEMDAREELDRLEPQPPRETYTAPRLTKHGSQARVDGGADRHRHR
jgi:hypothetical protein